MKTSLVIWFLKNDGVRTSAASAPRSAARMVAAIVAFVDSRPVPTISGRSFGTFARAISTTRSASSSSSCGASPLLPSTTSPVSGVVIHRLMLPASAFSSSVSSLVNGVAIGVKTPANRFELMASIVPIGGTSYRGPRLYRAIGSRVLNDA